MAPSISSDPILVATDAAGIATVTLNRPEKRNAMTLAMWQGLGAHMKRLGDDPKVRVVVLAGAGGNFCAGADISEFPTVRQNVEQGRIYEHAVDSAALGIRDCPKPTIAAVTGFGVGGGCGLALACDLRVGDTTTRMGIPAGKLGIVYGTVDTSLLLRAVGLANAKLVLYSARFFAGAEARDMGLIDRMADTRALDGARALAAEIAANAPLSVAGSKLVLEILASGQERERAAAIRGAIEGAMASDDYREAAKAFIAKTKPVFRGS